MTLQNVGRVHQYVLLAWHLAFRSGNQKALDNLEDNRKFDFSLTVDQCILLGLLAAPLHERFALAFVLLLGFVGVLRCAAAEER